MCIVLAAILFNCLAFVAEAQKSEAELQAVANLLTVQKKEAVAKLVSVTGKDSIAFWKVYADYQNDNQKLMMERINLYEGTANSYNNLNNGIADSLASKYFANREDQEKLLETYYKKLKTATNSVVAFQFYQAETYLLTQIRANIMSQIPTYGELKNAFKKN
jgi:lipopolysaccharide export LptBFGC system permease protein LptF